MAFILLVRDWTRDGSAKWVPVDAGTRNLMTTKSKFWADCGDEVKIVNQRDQLCPLPQCQEPLRTHTTWEDGSRTCPDAVLHGEA
jgi:hypothetical protein